MARSNSPARRSTFVGLDWIIPAVLVIAFAALVLLAPKEATIGQGIQIVYVHVALIWTGMLGLVLSGVLGVFELASPGGRASSWLPPISWVALAVYALGVGTSLIAEEVNWGGIAWQEPRTAANLNLLAAAVVAQIASSWINQSRIRGAIHLLFAVLLVWVTVTTELQLHPDDAVGSSSSTNIRFTFYALTFICTAASAWLCAKLHHWQK